jgi:hypothetical protein
MTLEEWLDQPFKTDGLGEYVTNREFYSSISRAKRKYIASRLKKGRKIDFDELFNMEDEL